MFSLCSCWLISLVCVIVLEYRAKDPHPHLSHCFDGHGGRHKAYQIRCWRGWEGLLPLPKNQWGPKGGSWRPILPQSLWELPAQLHLHTQVWHMHWWHFLKLLDRIKCFAGLFGLVDSCISYLKTFFTSLHGTHIPKSGLNVWF